MELKKLANVECIGLLRTVENRTFDASRVASAAVVKEPTIGAFPSTNAAIGTSLADITHVAVMDYSFASKTIYIFLYSLIMNPRTSGYT
ncbi:topless-related protein [Trifolium repens]|nr:topless-related protein [Trifolium repens]